MSTSYCYLHKSHWGPVWSAVCLAAFMPLASSPAAGAPGVLVITQTVGASRKLVSFSSEGRKDIAELSGNVIYGTDENSAAFVQLEFVQSIGPRSAGVRLLVVDRKTLGVITDKMLEGVHSWPLQVMTAERVAVRSKDSIVYFQTFDQQGNFGYSAANWKTGEVRPVPLGPRTSVGDASALISLPSGFAAVGVNRRIALYDATSRTELPMPDEDNGYHSLVNRRVYYVPTIGLMEFYKGTHRQLTDTNLSAVIKKAKEFSGPAMTSKVFVRNMDGKPFLIWGENKEPKPQRVPPTGMTELVIFDPGAKQEVLRKPLGDNFSEAFQPNQTGTRIYFIKPETGTIFCLDRESQQITSFATTRIRDFSNWNGSAMVDAD